MAAEKKQREIVTLTVATYVIVDKANNRTGIAVVSSDEKEIVKDLDCEYSYMQLGLAGLTKIIQWKIDAMVESDQINAIDINFCTNNANLAKAVTRAFIMARKLHQEGIDPITELRRRGKDIEAYLPLIQAVARMYEVCKGVRQTGYVGTKARYFAPYGKAMRHVRAMGIKVNDKDADEACTALSN